MPDPLIEILKSEGPQLSSKLAHLLVKKAGITAAAARQRISRGNADIRSLQGINFPHNTSFIYLTKDFGSEQYWSKLIEELHESGSIYGHALACLKQRDGVVPLKHFSIACGAPRKQKKHLSPETILKVLQEANLVKVIDVLEVGRCVTIIQMDGIYDAQAHIIRSRLITERILLQALQEWIRNLGFSSFNLVKIRDEEVEQPSVSTIEWDLAGPSYLGALVTTKAGESPKPGFVACDVYLGSTVTAAGIRPFIHKCQKLRGLRRVGRCLQIFVAQKFDPEAFDLARKNGIIPATITNLFGKDVAEGFKQLLHSLRNVAELCRDSEKLGEIFNRLNAIEGASNNLRGAVFAMIGAEVSRQLLGANNIETGRIFEESGKRVAEVDIVATVYTREIHFIECKGYQPHGTINDNDIEIWLKERIPYLYFYARQHPEWKDLKCNFHYWISSRFSDESASKLQEAKSKAKRYAIDFLEGSAFFEFAKETGNRDIVKILSEHYTNHPYSQARRSIERKKRKEAADARYKNQPVNNGHDEDGDIPP